MHQIIHGLTSPLNWEFDPRTKDLYFTNKMCLLIVPIYIITVTKLLPKIMENRQPFKLKNILIIYNATIVVCCLYLVIEASKLGWVLYLPNWIKCRNCNYASTIEGLNEMNLVYYYHLTKYIELLDTIFFLLRKKNNQITFLHVFHHSSMPVLTWYALKCVPGGSMIFLGYLNSLVHVLMYSYYLLAALGPQIRKFLWWKKYLTIIQLIQFILMFIHIMIMLFSNCNVPKSVGGIYTLCVSINFVLFRNFYNVQYTKKSKEPEQVGPSTSQNTFNKNK